MTDTLLNAALKAAERGWAVFPLRPGDKRPALHGESRCPGTGSCTAGHVKWEQRATTDPDRIRRAWSAGAFNVGLATGPSGLVVIDLDKPKGNADAPDGATTFKALCERHGKPVPATRTIRTASGGTHLYFTAPAAARLHNTASTLAPLVDTRAWGGYVVAPGSIVGQATYETVGPALIRPLPDWLQLLLCPPHPVATVTPMPARSGRRAAEVALERETAAVRGTTEGGRNARLLAGVRSLGRFVAWGDLDRVAVETAFQEAGEAAGLSAGECRTTIASALNWSLRTARPREAA
ncbi:bifunctional DNA primase/polymerase [Streptomyces sp. NPDC058686]|uniref:bifunctional DNA primase/polymerase n=1 Tax=Streptomyces sp. NPDC058686 TaxID=3346599 RepID=UPI00365870FA